MNLAHSLLTAEVACPNRAPESTMPLPRKVSDLLTAILLALLGLASAAPCGAAAPLPADHAEKMARGQEVFRRQVRPLLLERCVKCHGGDKTRGGLNLVTREALLAGGDNGAVLVPFDAGASRLYRLAAHLDKPSMPPAEQGPRLTAEQLRTLAGWIDLGAPYDQPLLAKGGTKKPLVVTEEDRRFWSFRPLVAAPSPAVRDSAWCRTPIDRFILAALEARGLVPNPSADKRTLLRRACFDLTGLPPSPEEVQHFLADSGDDAYDRLLDRLLASTSPASPRATASSTTTTGSRPITTAISSSAPSTRTFPTTPSSAGSWPATSTPPTTRWR
jgi:mono/diheme cytochrome c family protein